MWSRSLPRIDGLSRQSHRHLTADDECYALGEYTPRAGYAFGETNDLISNLKKDLDRKDRPEWRYKVAAIAKAGRQLAQALRDDWLAAATLVPMPPSLARSDPAYDDRMCQVLRRIARLKRRELDIRELIYQDESTRSSSRGGASRLTPSELRRVYRLDAALLAPRPREVALFDDVLTTGAHFKAAKELLRCEWPELRVVGVFVARCVQ